MRVFTYYDPVLDWEQAQLPLIELWKKSWTAAGWQPAVLGWNEANATPEIHEYHTRILTLPTVNPIKYEMACYLRWLAIKNVNGGLMTDYDVMNYGFTPDDCQKEKRKDRLTFFEGHVPSVVYGEKEDFSYLVDLIKYYVLDGSDNYEGRPHISDMYICAKYINRAQFRPLSVVKVPLQDGWQTAKLLHFCASFSQGSKVAAIQKFRPV